MTAPAGIDERLVSNERICRISEYPSSPGIAMSASSTSMSAALKNLDGIARVRGQRNMRAAIFERTADQLARIFLIVDDQHSNTVEPRLGAGLFARRDASDISSVAA